MSVRTTSCGFSYNEMFLLGTIEQVSQSGYSSRYILVKVVLSSGASFILQVEGMFIDGFYRFPLVDSKEAIEDYLSQ
jgi:hypothetical protein